MSKERAAALANKIEVHGNGAVTLPKPEWKGWTLSQEADAFEAARKENNAINDALYGSDPMALGYYVNPRQ